MDKTIEEQVEDVKRFADRHFRVLNTINNSITQLEDALDFVAGYTLNVSYMKVVECLGRLHMTKMILEKEIAEADAFVDENSPKDKDHVIMHWDENTKQGDVKQAENKPARVVTEENGDRFVEFTVRSKLNPEDYGEIFIDEQALGFSEGGFLPISNLKELRILITK
jgi:hypothetical protein